jgi:hypothetical protein
MLGELPGASTERDRLGRYKPGNNSRTNKQARIAAKFEVLAKTYFPDGGYGPMDANRLQLAAAHYVMAATARDPVVAQRSARLAEYLLAKIKRIKQPRPTLGEMLRGTR